MYICCLEWEKQRISLSVSFNYMLVIQLTNRVTLAIPQLVAIENNYTKYIRCMQLLNLRNTTLTAAVSYLYHKYSIVKNLYK